MKSHTVDLLISHHQIFLRSVPFQEQLAQWGKGNIAQGMILHSNFVVFDPIAEGSFGASVNLFLRNDFKMDKNTQRAVAVPFQIIKETEVFVGSVAEEYNVELPFLSENYLLYYEVCVKDEVYYNFTFIKNPEPQSEVLINDEFGLTTSTQLKNGLF